MPGDLQRVLAIEVPVKVVIGDRDMPLRDIIDLMPGTIIEFPKHSDEELELVVNNKAIGTGNAVKIGENFGIRITYIGDLQERIAALGGSTVTTQEPAEEEDAEALAAQLLAGQV